ncbi:GTPase [Acinetobacter entericus]|uniref:G domain-containing protein n=1 Tax=Acinetobacter entericus TaxID=2989714 RepID=A0ABT3NKK4_9GAMM|nr:GTPase [Acinetobacter entericus]MCW8040081.1 hypothetical protein [Acinetobacter entericus]
MNQEQKWFYLDQQHQQHIVSSSKELLDLYNGQVIKSQSYVWRNGLEDWERFQKLLPELQAGTLQISGNLNSNEYQTEDYFQDSVDFDEVESTQANAVENFKKKYSEPYAISWASQPHRENNIDLMQDLIHVLNEQKKLEGLRIYPNRVDGQIIGTGEADFTKDNVSYEFTYKDKTFQLIDVPGIEGDESKYEHLVHKAVAKAHLVFYVNGAGKKPEKKTAQKIKSYLNDYAKVYPILNLRGPATSYYADEDSDEPYATLEQAHGGASKLFDETLDVLKESIGEDLIQGGQYMQGLMAFSALAYNPEKKETTIFFGRNHDLGRDQKKFLQLFKDTEKMADFSKIGQLQEYIVSKFDTFKQDIVESNKHKISRRVEETIEILQTELEKHQILQSKVKKELDFGLAAINELTNEFEYSLKMEFENISREFFSKIAEESDKLITQNDYRVFGKTENEKINSGVGVFIRNNGNDFKRKLTNTADNELNKYKDNLKRELSMMSKNVGKVIHSMRIANKASNTNLNVSFDSSFDVKGMMGTLANIGGMVALGATLGSFIPVVGNIVGGIAGAVIGAVVEVINSISGKEKRIARRQSNYRDMLRSKQSSVIYDLNTEVASMKLGLQTEIRKTISPVIEAEYQKMRDIERILSSEIQTISSLKQRIKEKEYGAV